MGRPGPRRRPRLRRGPAARRDLVRHADYTVNPVNATESRDQWTDVLGVSQTPTSTATLPGGTTAQYYGDVVALYGVPGVGHGTPVDPGSGATQCGATGTYYPASICSSYYIASFWGLGG